ncbi:MAG: sulfatase [Planctomycetota bacterium]|nr:sulfatase [Planctomycetota bacterium]
MSENVKTAFAILVIAGLATVHSEAEHKFNVLFIICDDLNCDLGSYGHPMVKSPNIDRLAERGMLFKRAYCQYPLCGPSRASFMTGMYPDQTLIHRNAIRIRERLPDVVSMSQHFMNNGYQSARVGKLYHYNVPADIGNDGHDDPASWHEKVNPRGRDKTEENKVFSLVPGRFGGTLSWLAADGTDDEQTDAIGAEATTSFLEKYSKNKKPFFLAFGLYRPHTPYVAPKKYFDMYDRTKISVPKNPEGYLDTIPLPARRSIASKKEQVSITDDLARQAIQAYYASITFADAQVGRVLNALERLGLAKNTVVVFTSDHGYHMGEHGHYMKTTLFENADRVPLIISVPGMKTAGRTTISPAEMVDFYPTLAELCGLKPPAHLSGISLKPVLDDESAQPRNSALTQNAGGYSIRTDRYRYTEWSNNGAAGTELYDHSTDPQEMKNLSNRPEQKETIERLSMQLRERIAQAKSAPPGVERIAAKPREKKK